LKALSIVIPFFESTSILKKYLPGIIQGIHRPLEAEVILADATGKTEVKEFCDRIGVYYVYCKEKGRALQMNAGAQIAQGEWLFFLHIDSIPPDQFDSSITSLQNTESGCFQLAFDWDHRFLKFFAFFTRYYWPLARGGDQGLFVRRDAFNALNGFREIPIMEDVDICRHLMKRNTFVILPQKIITSARKYREQGVYRLQLIFGWITFLYWLGVEEDTLKKIYDKNIR
jgi:rSAM/selenodomain-associated transferase 2